MIEVLYMTLAFMAGLLLGTLFFGGLWYTVKRMVNARAPALWVLSSFVLRVTITLAGFYYISRGNWQRLFICAAGFLAARFLVIHLTKSKNPVQVQLKKETRHET